MIRKWALRKRDYPGSRQRRKAFRAFLAQHFRTDRVETHELVFGELVTNAVRYGDDPMAVAVVVAEDTVRIQVDNAGDCFNLERCLLEEPKVTSGRGLQIVRALVDTLTVESTTTASCRVTVTLPL
jgi:anti-sigma regulatory factor (Ser/Thr protein kinase)